ncbi:CaiB/BaiF CoA-transferase family protein [Nocardioides lentus]|uniref:CaiB/BaiF CoA-transferase family protein n=1 Tax=Nocardioides lentus TaxID=338077 RepID=A0ABP5ABQ4_9ACTN
MSEKPEETVTTDPSRPPLDGVLVADFSRVLAGPYATMILADLGADVVKVESPAGDDTRHWVPPRRGDTGTYYLAVNRGKRSIALDLKDAGDLALAHELSARADVFIHNFKPGGLDRFELGYDHVAARNPGSVYCSISGYGSTGGAHLPGYDLLVQAVSGLMSLTGDPGGPPYRAGISVFDVMTGLQSVIGVLAALRHREATGVGQHVETNLLSTAMSTLVNQTSAYVAGGVVPHRMGNAHLSLFPYEPMATGDGDLVIAAGNDGQYRRLVEALGAPELAEDPRFATVGDRNDHREELRPLLLERLATRSAQEWFTELSAAGVSCGPINDVAGGVELAESLGLEPVVEVGGVPTVRNAIRLSATPARYDRPPPELDGHGDEIRAWLGAPTDPAQETP